MTVSGDSRFPQGGGRQFNARLVDELLRRVERLERQAAQHVQGSLTKAPDGTLIGGPGVPSTKKGDLLYNDGTRLVRLVAPTAGELDGEWAALLFNPVTLLPEWVIGTDDCNPPA